MPQMYRIEPQNSSFLAEDLSNQRQENIRIPCLNKSVMWQVLLAFVDNWQSTGGVDEYVKWTGDSTKTHKDFYTDPVIMGWRVPECMHFKLKIFNS